jgi:hypothetical protein
MPLDYVVTFQIPPLFLTLTCTGQTNKQHRLKCQHTTPLNSYLSFTIAIKELMIKCTLTSADINQKTFELQKKFTVQYQNR